MSANRVILAIPRGRGKELRISLSEFKGATYVDLRTWYESDGGDIKPTREGVSFRPEHLAAVIKALEEAGCEIRGA